MIEIFMIYPKLADNPIIPTDCLCSNSIGQESLVKFVIIINVCIAVKRL